MMASDGTNTTTIDCQNDGTWSEPAIDCDCKIFSDFKLFEIERTSYSRVHISSDEVFSKTLKKPSIVQK